METIPFSYNTACLLITFRRHYICMVYLIWTVYTTYTPPDLSFSTSLAHICLEVVYVAMGNVHVPGFQCGIMIVSNAMSSLLWNICSVCGGIQPEQFTC